MPLAPRRLSAELIDGLSPAPADAWDELAAAAGTPNIFHERWMVEAMAMLPESAGLRLLLVWAEPGRLAGLLPLQTRRARGVPVALQVWEQRVRALGEPLILPGCEPAFWAAALPLLDRARRRGLYLRLTGLLGDSASTRALEAIGDRTIVETRRTSRAMLRAGLSAAEHRAAHVRGKVLKEQRRQRARLSERGTLVSEALAPDADPDPWTDQLFALELTGWKGRDGVAAAADPASEACFRAILREAQRRGRLDMRRLALDGAAVAMLATVTAPGGHGWQLKIAYDEGFAAYSPGVLLEMDFLDHALDVAGFARVDSCAREGHPMIDRIWPDRLEIVSLAVAYRGLASRLALAALNHRRRVRMADEAARVAP